MKIKQNIYISTYVYVEVFPYNSGLVCVCVAQAFMLIEKSYVNFCHK